MHCILRRTFQYYQQIAANGIAVKRNVPATLEMLAAELVKDSNVNYSVGKFTISAFY